MFTFKQSSLFSIIVFSIIVLATNTKTLIENKEICDIFINDHIVIKSTELTLLKNGGIRIENGIPSNSIYTRHLQIFEEDEFNVKKLNHMKFDFIKNEITFDYVKSNETLSFILKFYSKDAYENVQSSILELI